VAVERGRLITIEGLDGAGKSTLARALVEALAQRAIEVQLLREPGGAEVSERIRELVKDPALTVGARAEALLYAAARAQLAEERLEPLLAAGSWVVLDRFLDSSLAYQGGGRELGVEEVRAVNLFGIGSLLPDRTLLLSLPLSLGRERRRERADIPDRLEREDEDFFLRAAAAYEAIALAEPDRVRVLDARSGPDELLTNALRELSDLLAAHPRAV